MISASAGRGEKLYTFAGFTRFNGDIVMRYGGPVIEGKAPTPQWVKERLNDRTRAFAQAFEDDPEFFIVLFPLPKPTPAKEIAKMLSNINYIARLNVDAYEFLRDNCSQEEIRRACSKKQ